VGPRRRDRVVRASSPSPEVGDGSGDEDDFAVNGSGVGEGECAGGLGEGDTGGDMWCDRAVLKVLLLSLTAWTRLHGIISLEIEGVFTQMGIDPARLYTAEINHLIAQRLDAPTDG
jgi:hypothetical protein